MGEYKNPFSVDKRNTVFIDANDPRAYSWKLGQTRSRMGREVQVTGQVAKPLTLTKYSPTPPVYYWFSAYNTSAQAQGIGVDNSSNSFIAGKLNASTPYNLFIAKYDQQRTMLWQRRLYNSYSTAAFDISVDTSGNAVTVGLAGNGSTFDTIVAKYDTSGTISWQRSLNTGLSSITDNSYWPKVATDSSDNIYIAGSEATNVFLAKYNSSGTIQWQRKLTSSSFIPQVAVDSSGNPYILCYTSSAVNLIKYDSTGSLQWKIKITKSAENPVPYGRLKVDSSGNIYIGFTRTGGNQHATLVKVNSSGSIVYQKEITATSAYGNSYSIDIDPLDNVYWTGENGSIPFIVKLDSSGNILWQATLSGSSYINKVSDIAADSANVYLTGYNGNTTALSYTFTEKLPVDGSLTGTYAVPTSYGTETFSYTTSTFSLTTTTYTVGTSSLTDSAGTLTDSAGSLTDAATTTTITGLDI